MRNLKELMAMAENAYAWLAEVICKGIIYAIIIKEMLK
jgi:hypothetical protein